MLIFLTCSKFLCSFCLQSSLCLLWDHYHFCFSYPIVPMWWVFMNVEPLTDVPHIDHICTPYVEKCILTFTWLWGTSLVEFCSSAPLKHQLLSRCKEDLQSANPNVYNELQMRYLYKQCPRNGILSMGFFQIDSKKSYLRPLEHPGMWTYWKPWLLQYPDELGA